MFCETNELFWQKIPEVAACGQAQRLLNFKEPLPASVCKDAASPRRDGFWEEPGARSGGFVPSLRERQHREQEHDGSVCFGTGLASLAGGEKKRVGTMPRTDAGPRNPCGRALPEQPIIAMERRFSGIKHLQMQPEGMPVL